MRQASIALSDTVPKWKASGDWFDACKCSVPCPCPFARTPTYGDCDGVLAYHIKSGYYGETPLDGFNVLAIGDFKGNIWAGNTNANFVFFIDERAGPQQRHSLEMIFSGKARFHSKLCKAYRRSSWNKSCSNQV